MIEVTRTQLPAIRFTATTESAILLRYILVNWIRKAQAGDFGRGTSVDSDIRFAQDLADRLAELTAV